MAAWLRLKDNVAFWRTTAVLGDVIVPVTFEAYEIAWEASNDAQSISVLKSLVMFSKSPKMDLNHQPWVYKTPALPLELLGRFLNGYGLLYRPVGYRFMCVGVDQGPIHYRILSHVCGNMSSSRLTVAG